MQQIIGLKNALYGASKWFSIDAEGEQILKTKRYFIIQGAERSIAVVRQGWWVYS